MTSDATDRARHSPPDDAAFRAAFRTALGRMGLSMRAASAVMGRDPGYVAALLDPSRPSRARPTPADLLALSDGTGIPLIELLELLWAVPRARIAAEVELLGLTPSKLADGGELDSADRREVADFAGVPGTQASETGSIRTRPVARRRLKLPAHRPV